MTHLATLKQGSESNELYPLAGLTELPKIGDFSDERSFVGKKLRRIMIAINPTYYDEDKITLILNLGGESESFERVLKKIGQINGSNLYDHECDIMLLDIYVSFKANETKKSSLSEYFRYIFAHDDINYNHVNDICKTNLFNPQLGQNSYSICISDDIAISIFVDENLNE